MRRFFNYFVAIFFSLGYYCIILNTLRYTQKISRNLILVILIIEFLIPQNSLLEIDFLFYSKFYDCSIFCLCSGLFMT